MCPTYKFLFEAFHDKNLGSSVSVGTRLQAVRPEFNSGQRQWWDFFLFTTASKPVLGPPSFLLNGYWEHLPRELKWPEREADHLAPFSAEVKDSCGYISAPQYVFVAWCLNTGTNLPSFYLLHFRALTIRQQQIRPATLKYLRLSLPRNFITSWRRQKLDILIFLSFLSYTFMGS
jgi:hypothetical protein